eukprot:gene11231-13102_t
MPRTDYTKSAHRYPFETENLPMIRLLHRYGQYKGTDHFRYRIMSRKLETIKFILEAFPSALSLMDIDKFIRQGNQENKSFLKDVYKTIPHLIRKEHVTLALLCPTLTKAEVDHMIPKILDSCPEALYQLLNNPQVITDISLFVHGHQALAKTKFDFTKCSRNTLLLDIAVLGNNTPLVHRSNLAMLQLLHQHGKIKADHKKYKDNFMTLSLDIVKFILDKFPSASSLINISLAIRKANDTVVRYLNESLKIEITAKHLQDAILSGNVQTFMYIQRIINPDPVLLVRSLRLALGNKKRNIRRISAPTIEFVDSYVRGENPQYHYKESPLLLIKTPIDYKEPSRHQPSSFNQLLYMNE